MAEGQILLLPPGAGGLWSILARRGLRAACDSVVPPLAPFDYWPGQFRRRSRTEEPARGRRCPGLHGGRAWDGPPEDHADHRPDQISRHLAHRPHSRARLGLRVESLCRRGRPTRDSEAVPRRSRSGRTTGPVPVQGARSPGCGPWIVGDQVQHEIVIRC